MHRILFILGTRPEAIKLCPVFLHMRARAEEFAVRLCLTAQHRQMLDRVLEVFRVRADHDLNLMRPNQTLTGITARILAALEGILGAERPDAVVVQ